MSKLYVQMAIWSVICVPAATSIFVFIGTMCEYGDAGTVPIFLIFTAAALALVLNYIKTMVYIGRMKALDDVCRSDDDGSVPISQIAEYMHTTKEKVMRLKNYGEKKKILINLVYDAQGDRLILTDRYNPANASKDKPFVGMACPNFFSAFATRSG